MVDETAVLDIRIDRSETATVLRLSGDIDLVSSEWLRRAATDDLFQGLVVLDLAGVSFCDSSGLRVLIEMRRRADDAKSGFRLAAPTPEVDRLLDLSGIHDYLDLYPDVAAALAGRAGG